MNGFPYGRAFSAGGVWWRCSPRKHAIDWKASLPRLPSELLLFILISPLPQRIQSRITIRIKSAD